MSSKGTLVKVYEVTVEYLEPAGAVFKLLANSEEEALTIISTSGASVPGFKITDIAESTDSDAFEFLNETIPAKENLN